MAITIFVFILVLGVLIFVHELGHFLAARIAGVKVEEFAFGFPPRLLAKIYRGTRYAINAIPVGGYVKMLGENELVKDSRSFSTKSPLPRLGIVLAGVAMNYVLAIVVFAIGFTIGMTPFFTPPQALGGRQTPRVYVGQVLPGGAASQAGLTPGDRLEGFTSAGKVQEFTKAHVGRDVMFNVVNQQGKPKTVQVMLGQDSAAPLGVLLFETALVKLPLPKALIAGSKEAANAAQFTVKFFGAALGKLFTRGQVAQELGGPVAIFGATSQAAAQGFTAVLQLIGILSVNLAILNIVPFPALDGGRALFIAVEGIFGRKVLKDRWEAFIHTVGFAILIALILAITYRDIIRLR